MMRVLITGSGGRLGQALQRARPSGIDLLAKDKASLDICDEAAVERAFETNPDVIINAAAFAQVDQAEVARDEALAVNRDGPQILARRCAAHGIPLIHVSTDQVFGGHAVGPHDEEHPVAPVNHYGRSKVAGEEVVRAELERHLIVRTAWLMSRGGNNFVASLVDVGPEQGLLRVVRDRRSNPTPVRAIAKALLALALRVRDPLPWGTYHYAGVEPASLYDLARHVFDVRAQRGEALPELIACDGHEPADGAKRPRDSSLDCSKVERELGLKPPRWREAVARIIEGRTT